MNSPESHQNYHSYCISDISTSTYKSEIEKVVEGLGLPYELQIWVKKNESISAIFRSTQLLDSGVDSDLEKPVKSHGLFDSMDELNGFIFGGKSLLVRGIREPKPGEEEVKPVSNKPDRVLELPVKNATHPSIPLSDEISSKSSSPKKIKKSKRPKKSESPEDTKVGVRKRGNQSKKSRSDVDFTKKREKTQVQSSSTPNASSQSPAPSTSESIPLSSDNCEKASKD